MNPVEPREDGRRRAVIAEDQPQYIPLPATIGPSPEVEVTTEWGLTPDELRDLNAGGRVRLRTWTFGLPFQPVNLSVA